MTRNGFTPKGAQGLTIGAAFIGISCAQLFDHEPMARLFGFFSYLVALALVANFFWHEIEIIYEKPQQKRQKITLILFSLSVLIFAPLMVALMIWQCVSLYKKEEKVGKVSNNQIRQRNLKSIAQYYLIAVLILIVGTSVLIYSNFVMMP